MVSIDTMGIALGLEGQSYHTDQIEHTMTIFTQWVLVAIAWSALGVLLQWRCRRLPEP